MAKVSKLDSNFTELRYAEEASIAVLPAVPVWLPLEPNTYNDFGGQITTVARNPINPSRQLKKGVVTDLDASGGFNTDITQINLQDILQGFFFADLRRKNDVGDDRQPRRQGIQDEFADYLIQDISGANEITMDSRVGVSAAVVAGGTGYAVGDIVEVTNVSATIATRWIVTAEAAGVVTAVALVLAGFIGGREGRVTTANETGVAAPTTVVTGGGDAALTLTVTYGDGLVWQVGDLVFLTGNNDNANNGLKTVTVVLNDIITVAETLTLDAAPAATATMTTVGFLSATGDIDVNAPGGVFPELTSTVLDFTTLGLIVGEWIFVGGDTSATQFSNAVNNGFARIRSITAGVLVLDKTDNTMVTEANTTETIQLFFGRVLKNETGTLIRRRTYNLERTLGAPDDALPAEVQAEYLVGSVPSEYVTNVPQADKLTSDLSFTSTDNEQIDGPTPLKSGDRPALIEADAFNTSSDFSRIKLATVSQVDSNIVPLFAFATELTITINNNTEPNKAVGVLGAFDITAGSFQLTANITAYFADVAAVQAVRNNADITLDLIAVKANAGIAYDIPLSSLGDGRLNVEQDQPITLPLTQDGATGAKIDPNLDHTLLMVFFDYLPNLADT